MSNDDLQLAVDLAREALTVVVKLSFPVLLVGLFVGLTVSVLQAATQVQEQTLSFVPKMFAIALVFIIIMPWLMTVLVEYTEGLVSGMGGLFQ